MCIDGQLPGAFGVVQELTDQRRDDSRGLIIQSGYDPSATPDRGQPKPRPNFCAA